MAYKPGIKERLKERLDKDGLDGRYPLLNNYVGEHILRFEGSRFSPKECLIVECVALKSGHPDLAVGSTVQILRPTKTNDEGQQVMWERALTQFAVKAFGYDNVEEFEAEKPDWLEQICDTDKPDYLGRAIGVRVQATGIMTKKGEEINREYFDPSEEL